MVAVATSLAEIVAAVADQGDLAPTDAIGEVRVLEPDGSLGAELGRAGQRALEPQRLEPSLAGEEAQHAAALVRDGRWSSRRRAAGRTPGRALGRCGRRASSAADSCAVAVGVDALLGLDRGQLGQVDHVVDAGPRRCRRRCRRTCSGQVAERMGARRCGTAPSAAAAATAPARPSGGQQAAGAHHGRQSVRDRDAQPVGQRGRSAGRSDRHEPCRRGERDPQLAPRRRHRRRRRRR